MYQPMPQTAVLPPLLKEVWERKQGRIQIMETGDGSYGSTATIAQWVAADEDKVDFFKSISLDGAMQERCHKQLEIFGLNPYCTFHTQSPLKWLSNMNWLDFVLLNPESLDDGLQQFALAISAGAGLVVIHDYQHGAASAVRKAMGLGWIVENTNIYSILRRP
jgi:hypothetical protein